MNSTDDGTISARVVFAKELARQRRLLGISLVELAKLCNYEQSYLHRLETGSRLGTLEAAQSLDQVYGTGTHIADLWKLAKEEAKRDRYGNFEEVEAVATSIQEFCVSTVPGLLQTSGYAEDQLRAAETASVEEQAAGVVARIKRQDILTGKKVIAYRALIDESVLKRPTLDPEVWTGQLEKLIEAAQQPNIALQVVPFRAGLYRLLPSSMKLLWLPTGQTVAYVESSWSGQLIEEFEDVEQLRLSYDRLRDSALSPSESLDLLRRSLEDHTSCLTPPSI
ncbi:Helix-turn-helix domain-containing protein [Actinacidiphila yanglinensis]|uniref:Helix-turn-helix domain-containing protein n=1 Tax=Actinacidiphila yanglinensis TaxID=310779 RepID=A0A1H6A2M3_9ACTN|nr:helix-turn-helix transcriptional regulator [Actinacidiphila yanglinensis]SEG42217.1 Helix-turn-helix domain-containing protein [Actinacidiphila yanglinensis]